MMVREYYHALKFRFNRFPSHVILFVTARCNAQCRHCFYWQKIRSAREEDELTLAEIEEISKKTGHVKLLSVTGGEPSLRDDIPDIVSAFCRNNGTQHVVLHTNGFLSEKTRDIAARIVKENRGTELNVSVSLDGLDEIHDLIRGVPGAFDKAIRTIELLIEEKRHSPNLNVTVNACFNAYNTDTITELSDFLYRSYRIDGFSVSYVRGDSMDNTAKEVDVASFLQQIEHLNRKNIIKRYYNNYPLASLRRTLDFMVPKMVAETLARKKMIYPCMAGKSTIVISEAGELKPCEMLPASYGNIRDYGYDIMKMLDSVTGREIRKSIADGTCCCTWECVLMSNIIFNWRAYPRLLYSWLALEYRKHFGR